MNSIRHVDELVREYLLFRGFHSTLRAFDVEHKADRLKGFQVDKIVDQLFSDLTASDYEAFDSLWSFLCEHFFSRLDSQFTAAVWKLELSLLRYYVVNACRTGRHEKVRQFFEESGHRLHVHPEWTDWFVIPFIKQPELDPRFEAYFSKQWLDTVTFSLHNFLSTVFHNVRLPKILSYNLERTLRRTQQAEIEALRAEVTRLTARQRSDYWRPAASASASASGRTERRQASGSSAGDEVTSRSVRQAAPPQQVELKDFNAPAADSSVAPSAASGTAAPQIVAGTSDEGQPPLVSFFTPAPPTEVAESGGPGTAVSPPPNLGSGAVAGPATAAPTAVAGAEIAGEDPQASIKFSMEKVFSGHSADVVRCRFSPTGELAATCSSDKSVRVFSLDPESKGKEAAVHFSGEVLSLSWMSKSDRLLVAGSSHRHIKVLDVPSKKIVGTFVTDGEYPHVTDIEPHPTDPFILLAAGTLSGDRGTTARVDLKAMKLVPQAPSPSLARVLRFNHNGSLLVAGYADGFVRIHDLKAEKPIMEWATKSPQVGSLFLSGDETSIFTLGTDGNVAQWSMHSPGRLLHMLETGGGGGNGSSRHDLRIDPSGRFFAMTTGEAKCDIYRLNNAHAPSRAARVPGHAGVVHSVDWHPTTNLFCTASSDESARVFRFHDLQEDH